MDTLGTNKTKPIEGEQQRRTIDDLGRLTWKVVEELRINSGLKFDEYARIVLGLVFLAHANQQSTKLNESGQTLRLPDIAKWDHLFSVPPSLLGDALNRVMCAIESENEHLRGTVTQTDYNRPEKPPLIDLLRLFFQVSAEAADDTFAKVYEFLLDRFARASGQRSGEFSSPKEITTLLVELVKPQRGMSVYDPCVGTAGVLLSSVRYVSSTQQGKHGLSLFGQEINQDILSIGRMHLAVNGETDALLLLGNTLSHPRFVDQGRLTQFDRVIANPPFSVSLRGIDLEHDPYAQFRYGPPPKHNGDFAFLQHMIASLKPHGRMAVVAPHGVLFRGGKEERIRQGILDDDLLEAVIGLAPRLFYGSEASAAVLIINKKKPLERVGKVLFINADRDFERDGRVNKLRPEDVARIVTAFDAYSETDRFSHVVDIEAIRANSYNLNIPRYADSSSLAGLVSHYDNFAKHTIKELAVEVNAAKRGGAFEDVPNAVYIPIVGKRITDRLEELDGKHDRYYQVILNERAINAYVAQFLGTSVGQHALSLLAMGSVVQRLNKDDLQECIIALPDLKSQQEIVATHRKLSSLKEAISEVDHGLSLNPTGLKGLQKQLDSMLLILGELSDADYVRSKIREGESKTVEFKESLSLDLKLRVRNKPTEEKILKTIVAFLNTDGGVLLIGVRNNGTIAGLCVDLQVLHGSDLDKCLLHFKNLVMTRIGTEIIPDINYRFMEADEQKVLVVQCNPSNRPCFLDNNEFYVRTTPSSQLLRGAQQYEYVKTRFRL
ncbi:MAG: hypothetical protein C0483_04785 [Pirellula sp.]|nr:hypothetical protein [Pirellula sp.]